MANSLLDFVMSLVRDPDAAARYAADPAGAIAAADLTDVSSTDVDNLIPVVSESISMTGPTSGFDAFGAEPADNVWASGAATAAFDAFGDPGTGPVIDDAGSVITDVLADADPAGAADGDADPLVLPEPLDTVDPVFADAAAAPVEDLAAWVQPPVDDAPHATDGQAFDLFD